jgi:hypothetical protein
VTELQRQARLWAHPDGVRLCLALDGALPAGDAFRRLAEGMRASVGARWDSARACWVVRPTASTADALRAAFPAVSGTKDACELLEASSGKWDAVKASAGEYPEDMLDLFKTSPYKHQLEAAATMAKCGQSWALLMEMGTGKTLALALWLAKAARDEGLYQALLLCPKSIAQNEAAEFNRHCPGLFDVEVLKGPGAAKAQRLAKPRELPTSAKVKVFVLNYDALASPTVEAAARVFCLYGPTAVVCDESTKIKSAQAKRAKAAWRVGKAARWRGIMTGSPVADSPLDAFGQWRFLDESAFGASFTAFRNRYCVMGGFQGYEVVAYRNMAELKRVMMSHAFRAEKADCLDLPPKTYEKRTFKLPAEAARAYAQMAKDLLAEYAGQEWTAAIALTKLLRLREITSGYVKDGDKVARFSTNPKAALLQETLEDSGAEKAVVWCREREEILIAAQAAKDAGYGVFELHGGVKDKLAAVDAFQAADGKAALVAQVATGGLGFTMAKASLAVYFSNDFSRELRVQSEDRLHRSGQVNPVLYVDLVAEGTVDEYVLDVLAGKADTAGALTQLKRAAEEAVPMSARGEF